METPGCRCGCSGGWVKGRGPQFNPRLSMSGLCLLLLLPTLPALQPKHMYLNSYAHCGHGDSRPPWHKVDHLSLYSIRDDVRTDTGTHTFMRCEMVFRSTRIDGHLCVFQRQLYFENKKLRLSLFDGEPGVDGKVDPDKTVDQDQDLAMVEWCTESRFLTVLLEPRAPRASVRDVNIDILVYERSSVHRKAYMDKSPSCGSVFDMDGSKVNVTNMASNTNPLDLHGKCTLHFHYQGHEANRSLCMVFEPLPNLHCQFNYTLRAYEYWGQGDSQQEVLSHEGTCQRPFPRRWCGNSSKLALTLERHNTQEDHVMFHALVLDHHGGPSTLPLIFAETEDEASVLDSDMTVLIGAVCGALLLLSAVIILVIVYYRRRQASTPKASSNGDANNPMLNQGSARNGQNHYTEGTPASV